MRSMAVLGIGASLMCAFACDNASAMPAYSSTRNSPWNTAAPPEERPCYVWQTPDSDTVIMSHLHVDGWPLLGKITCTEDFLRHITSDGTELQEESSDGNN